MQGLWYGDRRDRVKWGALVYLARLHDCPTIVQVAYYREGEDPLLKSDEDCFHVDRAVWEHFSDLRHIRRLGKSVDRQIDVINRLFVPKARDEYVAQSINDMRQIDGRKLVFLDPDTGIQPRKCEPEHVSKLDIHSFWQAIREGDLLAVYQHADRTKSWVDGRRKTFSEACGGIPVSHIDGRGVAADVAILWAKKDGAV